MVATFALPESLVLRIALAPGVPKGLSLMTTDLLTNAALAPQGNIKTKRAHPIARPATQDTSAQVQAHKTKPDVPMTNTR